MCTKPSVLYYELVLRSTLHREPYTHLVHARGAILANGRRLTNLGSFRAYLDAYLSAHPDISDEMTFLVRQLAPGPEGLPIEIYVFSKEQRWVQYEGIIGDIFDHVIASLPTFGLRPFQRPTGTDLTALASAVGSR